MTFRQAQDRRANPVRGEAELVVGGARLLLRPTFERLVAAEGELGPLFALVERAAEGRLTLGETAGLLWHCLDAPDGLTRERVGDTIVELGLARTAPVVKAVLAQILAGRV